MAAIAINVSHFNARLEKLLKCWSDNIQKEESPFYKLDSIVVVMGSADEDNPYQKTAALHTWLLGYEFPATLILITLKKVVFVTSANKAKFLEPVSKSSSLPVELLLRTKDEPSNAKQLETIIEYIETGEKVGLFLKDSYKGKFIEEWNRVFSRSSGSVKQVDVGTAIAPCMSIKDEDELEQIQTASTVSSTVLSQFFVSQMSTIVDEGKKVTHSALAERVERVLENTKFMSRIKAGPNFDPDQLEWCYTPIIQSGSTYDLKPSAMSDDEQLHSGVILCSLGLRYKSYCSNIGRTFLIDPTSAQSKNYDFLCNLQKDVLSAVRHGVVIRDLYNKTLDFIRNKEPDLEKHFLKNIGSGIGIDFRDTSLILNAKNTKILEEGMTLNLSVGFQDIPNAKGKDKRAQSYSLLLIDTIKVQKATSNCLTESAKSKADISYFFNDDDQESKVKPKNEASLDTSIILSKKTRGVAKPINETNEQRRREHQKELAIKLQEEGIRRFPVGASTSNGTTNTTIKKFESYRRDGQLPSAIRDLKIVVDHRNQSVLLPIYGRPVPFHINTIKNVSKNDEGDFVYLRINLLTPGQVIGKKDDTPFEDPSASFVRSLTFRSADIERMSEITKEIQEMKKNATKKEAERKELADVVEQDNLVEVKSKLNPPSSRASVLTL